MAEHHYFLLIIGILFISLCYANEERICNVNAKTDAGWICGLIRKAENGADYASFRGIPYAKQPTDELRFKELQPVAPWDYLMETVESGPACPQFDPSMQSSSMTEECIFANVHVPVEALPHQNGDFNERTGLPIIVFIHGGGFKKGSGAIYGPEYLVGQDVIVITFNYRLNVFGFLSLHSKSIPGNAGLRDQITFLQWVQRNAKAFGGNPENVTLMGQSTGGGSAHLLSLSNVSKGLFHRLIILSGAADRSVFSASPQYSRDIAHKFLQLVGINSTDPENIHSQLVSMPLEQIMKANEQLQKQAIDAVFAPTVETEIPGVTRIINDTPANLISQGKGANLPLLLGFTNAECQTFRPKFAKLDIIKQIIEKPIKVLTPVMQYLLSSKKANETEKVIFDKFFKQKTLDEYIVYCTKSIYQHQVINLAQQRAMLGVPAHMYEFAYNAENSVEKSLLNLTYYGAGHREDLTFVLRINSVNVPARAIPPQNADDQMVILMTSFIINFVYCSNPTCDDSDDTSWPPAESDGLIYHYIKSPTSHYSRPLTTNQQHFLEFFNDIYENP